MYVTRHMGITDEGLLGKLWALYDVAFEAADEQAVSRQRLYRHEFDAELESATTRVWVVWNDSLPVAMTAVATDLSANSWVNDAYLAQRFPEHHARGAVHYCLFLLVHPDFRRSRALSMLTRAGFGAEAGERAVVVFDCPQSNQPFEGFGLADVMERLARGAAPGAKMVNIEVHQYYGLVLDEDVPPSPTAAAHPRRDQLTPRRARVTTIRGDRRRGGQAAGRIGPSVWRRRAARSATAAT
jgi:hypothetical protein